MSKLNDFISNVKGNGLAQTNIFSVEFVLPAIVARKRPMTNLRNVLLFCDSANIPGINISTNQIRSYGEVREIPYEKLYDNLQLTFYVDNTMEVKAIFDDWAAGIQDQYSRNFNYYKDYTTDIVVKILDKKDNTRYQIILYECYVKSIQPIQMDYGSKEVMKVSVSMNYKYWRHAESGVTYGYTSNGPSIYNETDYSSSVPIPSEYFTSFSTFQGKLNAFTGSDLIVSGQEYIGDLLDKTAVKQDLINNITTIKGNISQFGDNLNFDFKS